MKKPNFAPRAIERKKIYILEKLPEPMTRKDEHWQIFDDYTPWPEYRLRQIRVPETREWTRMKEEIVVIEDASIRTGNITREFIPGDGDPADGMHPDKEIRKNRYFFEWQNREVAVDIFLGPLWGLILAQMDIENDAADFVLPEFAAAEVSGNDFFRGENLFSSNFEDVKREFSRVTSEWPSAGRSIRKINP